MITGPRKSSSKITLYGISSFHFTVGINSKSFHWRVQFVQETSPNFLRRSMWVDNSADNADVTQSPAANRHRQLSHMTLCLIKCRKYTAWAPVAERFEPNTVLWAFHKIRPSIVLLFLSCDAMLAWYMLSSCHSCVRLSVCLSVHHSIFLSVHHKSEFYKDG